MGTLPLQKSKIDLGGNDKFREYGRQRQIKHFETEEFLEYRRQWFECPEKMIVPEYPLNLDIHVTNRCNLRCPFCPRTWKDLGGHYDEYGLMSMELYKRIIDEGVPHGIKAIQLTADGEPLLHPKLEEMIAYAREAGVIDIIVHTSAASLTEKRSRKLLDAGFHRLAISFDSPDKETYEKLRVGAKFEKTLENIKTFVRLRDEGGMNCRRSVFKWSIRRLICINGTISINCSWISPIPSATSITSITSAARRRIWIPVSSV